MRSYVAGCRDRVARAISDYQERVEATWTKAELLSGYAKTFAEWERVAAEWPLSGVWLGVSVEDQATADERIPLLLQTLAAVRFLSCEPVLAAVDLEAAFSVYDGQGEPSGPRCNPDGSSAIDWVIAGGESGPKSRPCDVAWIRAIRDQCREAGVPCFVKQLGSKARFDEQTEHGDWLFCKIAHSKGADMSEWPADLRVREFPPAVVDA